MSFSNVFFKYCILFATSIQIQFKFSKIQDILNSILIGAQLWWWHLLHVFMTLILLEVRHQ